MAALVPTAAYLRHHPDLQSLIIQDVKLTGVTIGEGSYGLVEEVVIAGTPCAAKRIHDFFVQEEKDWVEDEIIENNIDKFAHECKLMSRLRHPNIVQFLGLWFSQISFPPFEETLYLVMEKMNTNLHDMLLYNKPSTSTSFTSQTCIPLATKCSILQDIARGIAYLHKQKPPVIHRDLSAKNVLLNSAMVAKIADLGMARILPVKDSATMTKAPGATVYMPPESLGDKPRYNTSIDIFSLGVAIIFTLTQEFPVDLKTPNYIDEITGLLVARTELQRRENYTASIYNNFPKSHPLVQLIESCLDNVPQSRPSIDHVLQLLERAQEGNTHVQQLSRLQLLQHENEETSQQEKQKWANGHNMPGPGSKITMLSQTTQRSLLTSSTIKSDGTQQSTPVESGSVFEATRRSPETPPLIDFSSDHESFDVERPKQTAVTTQLTNTSFQPYIWFLPVPGTNRDSNVRKARHRVRGRVDLVKKAESEESGVSKPVVRSCNHPMEKTSVEHQQEDSIDILSDEEEQLLDNGQTSPHPFSPDSSHSTMELKPHDDVESWLLEVDRNRSTELLRFCKTGTFLCRPTSQLPSILEDGSVHTHTIDFVCGDVQHVRVFQQDGKYGFHTPCSYNSLKELIVHYSDHYLSINNESLHTCLLFPLYDRNSTRL